MNKKLQSYILRLLRNNKNIIICDYNEEEYYLIDGFCIFIIKKKDMIYNVDLMKRYKKEKVDKLINDGKERSKINFRWYLPYRDNKKDLMNIFESEKNGFIALRENFLQLYEYNHILAYDGISLCELKNNETTVGYILPVRLTNYGTL